MLTKKEQRARRAGQTRVRIAKQGVVRLSVHRTNLHIYASVISGCGTKVLPLHQLQKLKFAAKLAAQAKAATSLQQALLASVLPNVPKQLA